MAIRYRQQIVGAYVNSFSVRPEVQLMYCCGATDTLKNCKIKENETWGDEIYGYDMKCNTI